MLTLPLSLLLLVPIALAGPVPQYYLEKRDDDSFRTLSTASNPAWMGKLADTTSLAALSIPGTHESMAIAGGDIAQCQEDNGASADTLTAQLNAGIRMMDIRLRIAENNELLVHHGAIFQNANFNDVVDKLSAFLTANPTETVLLRVKEECTAELGSCTNFPGTGAFEDVFDSAISGNPTAQNLFFAPSVTRASAADMPTLGAVRGKAVLAVLHGAFGGRIEQYGLSQFSGWNSGNSDFVQDNFDVPEPFAIATKRDQVRRFLDDTSASDGTKLFVNFGSGSSLAALPFMVAGGVDLFVTDIQGVNPFLLDYLNQGADVHAPVVRTGALMLDFPGGVLINKILSFNDGL